MFKRTLSMLLVVFGIAGTLRAAANDAWIGDWKLNPSKSKLTDQMKVESVGANRYAFDFVGDGNAETIVADGTDQHGSGGTTLSVTAEGPDAWKVVRKKDGHIVITANWKLSKDGNTLTDDFTSVGPDGATSTLNYVYQRRAGGSGFAGTWVSTSETVNFVFVLQVRPFEDGGLSIIDSTDGLTQNVKFDGKDYPNAGPNAPPGSTSSIRRVNEHALEITSKFKGKITTTQRLELSSDGKTLMMTLHVPGRSEPNILVLERQ